MVVVYSANHHFFNKVLSQFSIQQIPNFVFPKRELMFQRCGKNGKIQHVFPHTYIRSIGGNGFPHQFVPQAFYPRLIELRPKAVFLDHVLQDICDGLIVFLFHNVQNLYAVRKLGRRSKLEKISDSKK